jgi:hypothetical protein
VSDQVSREDLAQTAPDPGDDFEGFLNVVADQVIAEIERGVDGKDSRARAEWFLMRSLLRLERGLERGFPQVALVHFAENVIRNIGRWSELLEQPDNGGKG